MDGWVDIKIMVPDPTPDTPRAILSSKFDQTSKLISGKFANMRNGGCGAGQIVCSRELSSGHEINIGDLVEVYLTTVEDGTKTNDDEKIYYGMILDIAEDWDNNTLTIPTVGLFHQASTIPVVYYKESSTVVVLIIALWANARGYTWWNQSTLDTTISSPVTVGDAEFGFTPLDNIVKKLAKLQGGIEYGIDIDGKFYFRDEVTTIRNQFQVGLNAFKVKKTRRGRDLRNALFIRANHMLSSGSMILYEGDASSISTYKRRAKVVTAPELKDPAKVYTWAENLLSTLKDERVDYSFKIIPTLAAQWPNGKIKLIDSDGTELANRKLLSVTYNFSGGNLDVQYKIGEEEASYEQGDEVDEVRRQVVFLQNQELSNDRISHTGYEEFKQWLQSNALAGGKYNFVMTEFEEDQV